MKAKKKTNKKMDGFVKNTSLDKYQDKVLFKEKIKMANHILKSAGIPQTQ